MMRIALIADIHGNAVVLQAVLADIERQNVDQVVCLGDVVPIGPQPRETLALVRELDCPVIMGNADVWLLDPQANVMAQRFDEISRWCLSQLTPADLETITTFQSIVTYPLGQNMRLVCFHGSPRSYDEKILDTTPPEVLDEMLAGYRNAVMAGGHTHVQLLRHHKDLLILNPGSVGLAHEILPSGEDARNPPWAEYGIVAYEDGLLDIALRRVPFDVADFKMRLRESGIPHAEWLAADWQMA